MASEKLKRISERVQLMRLRERVLVFAAVAVAVLALLQVLLIDGIQLRKQAAHDRLQSAQAALARIGQQRSHLAVEAGQDPDRPAREALAAQEARLAGLNAELDKLERSLIAPDRMNLIFKRVVKGDGGIRVVGFKTLQPQAVGLPDAGEGSPPGYYRHGFEITVSGRYADLVAYLERLEALPWRLSWTEAKLDAAARPELTLVLTVHTLSLEEAWLRV